MLFKGNSYKPGLFVPYLHSYKKVKKNLSLEEELKIGKRIHDAREGMYEVALEVPGFAKIALKVLNDLEKSKSYISLEDNKNYKSTIRSAKRLENPFFFKEKNRHHFELHTKKMVDNIAFTVLVSNGFGSSIIKKMKESEEMGDLSDKLEQCLEQKSRYVNRLVEAYEPVIDELAGFGSRLYGMSKQDIYQEANLAAMRAGGKYDYRKGTRFISYAAKEMIAYMSIAQERNRLIQLPRKIHVHLSRLRKYALDLFKEGKEESFEESAKIQRIPKKFWKEIIMFENDVNYLEDLALDDEDRDWNEFIRDEKSVSQLESTLFKELWARTYEKLQRLPKKFRDVLRFRYGITDYESTPYIDVEFEIVRYDESRTLKKVGKIYGVTREAIRQRQKTAIDKLREMDLIKTKFK